MFETVWQDVRHGVRMLAKNPGFSVIAIVSIAIGVGANTAMFSVADGLILRPLALPDANTLVMVSARTPTGEVRNGGTSYPDYADVRDRARSLQGLAASRGLVASVTSRSDESARGAFGLAVSGNFFDVLGVQPAVGRGFVPEEDRVAGRDAVVVLSHDTWTERFGADSGLVGRQIRLTGESFTVVGIAPEGFNGAEFFVAPAFYVPLAMLPALESSAPPDLLQHRDVRNLRVLGRLTPGATLAQAAEEVALIARGLQQQFPESNDNRGMLVRWERDARFSEFWPSAALSAILIGLALAVLLVSCANVAGLLTSRAPVRAREIALRLAIGGSRQRLMRQMITETALLAVAGGLTGLALGYAGIRSFRQFQVVSDVGVTMSYELDGRALAVGFAMVAVSALLSSVVPAWRTTRAADLSSLLRNASASASRRGHLWGRHGLVASQIALTLVLLTVALSFYRAFEIEYGRGPGFRTDHLLLTTVDPGLGRLDQQRGDAFYQRVTERAAAIPGVTAVAVTSFVPLSMDGGNAEPFVVEGADVAPGVGPSTVAAARVDESYLDTIGIPLVSGRGFRSSDTAETPRVAIVSRGMATRYWPGQSPLGKRIRLAGPEAAWTEVVGVAADIKFRLFTPTSVPFLYLPRRQNPSMRSTLVVRTAAGSDTVATRIRSAVLETDREVPVLGMRTMEAFYHANSRNLNTVVVRTIAGMGAMGLTLALIGLYGLTAYAVSRRTREIGVRMAMGALPASVLRMVLRQATLPSVAGIAVGVVASIAVGGVLEGAFPNLGGDAVTFLLIVPAVIAVVALATYVPARRAASIDPLVALRQE